MSDVWESVLGQERVVEYLRAAARKPGGTYLFSGPPGAGKSHAARVFAAVLVCPQSCGKCAVCDRVLRGIHPDVGVFEPEGYTFPVELIREIVAAAAETPIEAQQRVFILEEAERIAERSQNALLKALEEPGSRVTWILIARSVGAFLPTVLSRCRMVEFSPIHEDALLAELQSSLELPEAEAAAIVRAAGGDMSKSVALASDPTQRDLRALAFRGALARAPSPAWALDQADRVAELAKGAREKEEEKQKTELDAFDSSIGAGKGTAPARKRITDRHKRAARRVENDALLSFIGWMGTAFRDLAAASLGAAPEALLASDFAEEVVEAASARPSSAWVGLAERCLDAQLALYENATPALVVESVLLELVGS